MKKLNRLVAAVVLAAALMLPGLAQATDTYGYVCEVTLYPGTTTIYGSNGYANLTMYSGNGCTGSYLGSWWVFTTGATSSSANPWFLYTDITLPALYNALTTAATSNKQVHLWTNPSYPTAVGTVGIYSK